MILLLCNVVEMMLALQISQEERERENTVYVQIILLQRKNWRRGKTGIRRDDYRIVRFHNLLL